MTEPLYDFQMRLNWHALQMMRRPLDIDAARLRALDDEVVLAMQARTAIVERLRGRPFEGKEFNDHGEPKFFRSLKQITDVMTALGQKPGTNRKTGRDAFDDETLIRIAQRTPALRELCHAIIEFRSLGQMLSSFIRARLEPDGRLRVSQNPHGAETFRWSHSKNPYGRGCNIANVSTGDRGMTGLVLPNARTAIIPPPGGLFFEPDLAGADARVVAWDADDALMKDQFRRGLKIHAENAKLIFGPKAGSDGKAEPWYTATKRGVHASNYGAQAKTVAGSLGITVAEAETFQRTYFGEHPAIPRWHKRVMNEIKLNKYIENKFGYRIYYFGRIDERLRNQALAWIGQGTVACVTNRVYVALEETVPEVEMVINNHDSLVGRVPQGLWTPALKARIRDCYTAVVVPYDDPLVIPPSLKTSAQSWGDVEPEDWT